MRALHVPAEDVPRIVDLPDTDADRLPALQALVGGHIEALSIGDRPDVTIWGHDESKLVSSPENPRATLLVYGDKDQARQRASDVLGRYAEMGFEIIDATGDDPREPYVAGDVVITGHDPRTGATRAVPDAIVDLLSVEAPS